MYTCPAGPCCASLGKCETDDKCHDQPPCNVISNLVVTIRSIVVISKFVVTAVTTKLVISAYSNFASPRTYVYFLLHYGKKQHYFKIEL